MENINFVGIDDGHSSIKGVNGKCFSMQSKVNYGIVKSFNVKTGADDNSIYTINGQNYTISTDVDNALETRTDDFPTSDINIALVNHTLSEMDVTGDVAICTGLPFNRFYQNSEENTQLITGKVNAFKTPITANHDINFNIVQHLVCSQGVAVYFDLLLNDDGSEDADMRNEFGNESVFIIDIGGGTTDIVSFKNDNIQFKSSVTLDIGCLTVEEELYHKVTSRLNNYKIPKSIIPNIIKNEGLFIASKSEYDFSAELDESKLNLAGSIVNKVKQMISNTMDVSVIAFAGGGSILLKKELQALFPDKYVKFIADPVFSNARGMKKLLVGSYNG